MALTPPIVVRLCRTSSGAGMRAINSLKLARNVRTSLQQVRRNTQRNWRRSRVQRQHGNAEGRSRISGQHGDGVFKLRTLLLYQVELCLGRIEQRLLLRQIEA